MVDQDDQHQGRNGMTDDTAASEPRSTDLFQSFQKLTADMATLTRSLMGPMAPAAEPVADYAVKLAELYRASVKPLRAMLEEQQELADRLAAGLEQLRALTEQFSQWADQHSRLVEQTRTLVEPLLAQSERLAAATDSWADALKGSEPS
jgi:methyl-accepting chemotaxis protein